MFGWFGNPIISNYGGNYTISNVVRIHTNGSCEYIFHNLNTNSFYPQILFTYQGQTWGFFTYAGFITGAGIFDMNEGVFISTNEINLIGLPGIPSWKIWYASGLVIHIGIIYVSLYVMNKDTSAYVQVLTKFNPDTMEAVFVGFINFNIGSNDYIFGITII